MSNRSRKYMIKISSFIPPSSHELYDAVNRVYVLQYLGVYTLNGMIIIYIQFSNRIAHVNARKVLTDLGVEVESVSKCAQFVGDEIVSEKGNRPDPGGHLKRKRKVTERPSPPSTDLQPPTCLPKPGKVNNCKIIQDDIFQNMTSGRPGPNMFHAVWSSRKGLWFPHMWVGPHRNVRVTKRSSVKPSVVDEILQEQENKCRLCQNDVFVGTYSNSDVDHVIPLKHGGSSSKGNLQVLCVTCHRRKTALECKKIMTRMGSPDIDWNIDKIYLTLSLIHI